MENLQETRRTPYSWYEY